MNDESRRVRENGNAKRVGIKGWMCIEENRERKRERERETSVNETERKGLPGWIEGCGRDTEIRGRKIKE